MPSGDVTEPCREWAYRCHLEIVGGWEDGLKEAIWNCDRTLSGMGLQMPFGSVMDSGGDGLIDAIWRLSVEV